jgi:hypothetical protein
LHKSDVIWIWLWHFNRSPIFQFSIKKIKARKSNCSNWEINNFLLLLEMETLFDY